MSRTQQKYFAHNRTTRMTQNCELSAIHNHLFANRRRISPHHDTTSSHTSTEVAKLLCTRTIHFMKHPRYSPDLAPNDFCFGTHVLEIQYADGLPCSQSQISQWLQIEIT
ncbi:uncharacterized protein LOC110118661 [Ceratitis capitata]|uniref:uncharacterized protein LOC110118661 n=1 Tax=Ceratitis capitata TaxID=7213 RepID=UPI000A0FC7BD|nr:uncharacterized protein LOC110118661 [Ceratitis capitata]